MRLNPRLREVHRAEIKRRMNYYIDKQWDGLYLAFGTSIALTGVGARFCQIQQPNAYYIGAFFITLGSLFLAAYFSLLKTLRRKTASLVWLTPLEQFGIAATTGCSIGLGLPIELILPLLLLTGVYATWRLWRKAAPLWRIYYFRAGRDYFREVKSYIE